MALEDIMDKKYDEARVVMEVGEIIVPTPGYNLRSGCDAYDFAIVIQVEPLIAVSEETDMRWESTIDRENYKAIGKANAEAVEACMRRL